MVVAGQAGMGGFIRRPVAPTTMQPVVLRGGPPDARFKDLVVPGDRFAQRLTCPCLALIGWRGQPTQMQVERPGGLTSYAHGQIDRQMQVLRQSHRARVGAGFQAKEGNEDPAVSCVLITQHADPAAATECPAYAAQTRAPRPTRGTAVGNDRIAAAAPARGLGIEAPVLDGTHDDRVGDLEDAQRVGPHLPVAQVGAEQEACAASRNVPAKRVPVAAQATAPQELPPRAQESIEEEGLEGHGEQLTEAGRHLLTTAPLRERAAKGHPQVLAPSPSSSSVDRPPHGARRVTDALQRPRRQGHEQAAPQSQRTLHELVLQALHGTAPYGLPSALAMETPATQAVLPLLVGLLAAGALLAALLLLVALRRGSARAGRARQKGRAGHATGLRLLQRAGYVIEATEVEAKHRVVVDGQEQIFRVRADALVRTGHLRYVAEIKSSARAARPSNRATRRQLLEYAVAFDVGGVLLVDSESSRICVVRFPAQGKD